MNCECYICKSAEYGFMVKKEKIYHDDLDDAANKVLGEVLHKCEAEKNLMFLVKEAYKARNQLAELKEKIVELL